MKDKIAEERLQQQIFTWHWNTLPEQRGLLFMVHNNPANAREGAKLKAMGMLAGVSDMIYLSPKGTPMFLELKTAEGRQSAVQKQWQETIENAGYRYCIIRSLDDFKKLISAHE